MIGRIRGQLLEKNPPLLLVDVAGLGYEVEVPMSTFYDLPALGETVNLHVHMIVREDAQLLFGFATIAERSLFRALLKVNGVGARVALAILSGMSSQDFRVCILAKDVAALTRIPGIGKKTAERLVVEMADKLGDDIVVSATQAGAVGQGVAAVEQKSAQAQAVEALMALGYKATDASKLVKGTGLDNASVEDYIRAALKSIKS